MVNKEYLFYQRKWQDSKSFSNNVDFQQAKQKCLILSIFKTFVNLRDGNWYY